MADRAPIRALTVIQPWATLIAHGPKRVENRTWEPPRWLRAGFLAIHAGVRVDADHWADARACAQAAGLLGQLPALDGLTPLLGRRDRLADAARKHYAERAVPYGAVLAVARVRSFLTDEDAPADPWFCGPFGWVLSDVVAIEPVPCKGAQGLWELPPGVLERVRENYRAAIAPAAAAPPGHFALGGLES